MPVRIDKLGAHLEAYMKTRPAISAIEPFIIEPARAEILETWSSEFRCFELKCDIVDDHFTPEEKHKLYHHATSEVCFGESDCPFGRGIDAKTAAKHRDALVDYVVETMFWTDSNGIFNEYREIVRNHFGIEIWTSNVQLPPLSNPPAVEWWKRGEPQDTTVAYMTLPNNASSHEDWLRSNLDQGSSQSGYAMPLKVGAVPTQASLRRFPRAMNTLRSRLRSAMSRPRSRVR